MSTEILKSIQVQFSLYGNTIMTILGSIGSLLIVLIFSRQRANSCSLYLSSAAIFNGIYVIFNRLVQSYPFYFEDAVFQAFFLCKVGFYLPFVVGQLAKTMTTLACIDRFMITHKRLLFRAWCTPKRAKYLVGLSVIIGLLLCSHVAIMTTIIDGQCGTFGTYATIYTIYTILFIGVIPPIVMGIFGYLSYRYLRRIHARVQPTARNGIQTDVRFRQRDRNLFLMLISEVIVYIVTVSAYPVILLEIMISQKIVSNKSLEHIQIEEFIQYMAFFLLYANSAAPFFIYIISSKSFREDFRELVMSVYLKLRRQPAPVHRRNH